MRHASLFVTALLAACSYPYEWVPLPLPEEEPYAEFAGIACTGDGTAVAMAELSGGIKAMSWDGSWKILPGTAGDVRYVGFTLRSLGDQIWVQNNGLHRLDGGAWTEVSLPEGEWVDMTALENGSVAVVTTTRTSPETVQQVWVLEGTSWKKVGLERKIVAIAGRSATALWAVQPDGKIQQVGSGAAPHNPAPGTTWDRLFVTEDGAVWAVTGLGRDSGAAWVRRNNKWEQYPFDAPLLSFSPVDANTAWATGRAGLVLRLTAEGWSESLPAYDSYVKADDLVASCSAGDDVFAVGRFGVAIRHGRP